MIEVAKGNLLTAPVEALVNTVNTVGVMGKGIALQFKQAYPHMFREYERACKAGEVRLGKMHIFDLGGLGGGPRWIINFPTKEHWRTASRLSAVEMGLKDLAVVIRRLNIHSIAVPPLGCGNGGLEWSDVKAKIETTLHDIPSVRIFIYAPIGAPSAAAMPNRTQRSKMTIGQAALIWLIDRYLKGLLDPYVSLLEVHKLMYFLKAAGEPLPKLKFKKDRYGPYSPDLRHALIRMEGHFIRGFGEGSDDPKIVLELLPGAIEAAKSFLTEFGDTKNRLAQVESLIHGFEDPYGMELLSSVHWVMQHETPLCRDSLEAVISCVHHWSERKRRIMKPEHLKLAWKVLHKHSHFLDI
jgi:O-acetyl-ADP-ribose deacetylase (regulator of RNase III)